MQHYSRIFNFNNFNKSYIEIHCHTPLFSNMKMFKFDRIIYCMGALLPKCKQWIQTCIPWQTCQYSLVWVWVPLVPKPECVVYTGGCQSLELHVQIISDWSQSVSDYSKYYLFELGNDTIHHLCSRSSSVHWCWREGYYSQCKWYFEIWTSSFTSLSQYDFGCSSQHILIIECETEILFNNAAFNGPVLNSIPPFSKS